MKWFFQISSWVAIVIFVSLRGSINSEAGFACVSNPCVYGICIDDINSNYTCYCINGYTGIQCQTNWDECWSSPCANGGTCIDGIDAYNCSCPEGYTGQNCELDINECASNPCTNNGTCNDIPNGFTCQCNAGYSGECGTSSLFCDIDLAICNTSNEIRCHNGGQCIDGPGLTYTCECQPGWTGALCESEINECASSPCQNGAVCIDQHADYSCACLFGYTGHRCETELELCDMNLCANGALCLIEDDVRVCYCVPDFHGDRCQLQYDECVLRGRCYNGGTCIDGVDNYTCSCPPRVTGFHCECIIDSSGNETCDVFLSTPMVLDSTSIYETETSKIIDFTTKFFTTSLPTTLSTNFDIDTVSSQGTTTSPTNEPTTLTTQEEFPTTVTTESKQKSTTIIPETTTTFEAETTTEFPEKTTTTTTTTTQTVVKTHTQNYTTTPQITSTSSTLSTLETIIYPNTTILTDKTPSSEYPETKIPTEITTVFFTTILELTTQSKFSTFDTTAKSSVIIPSTLTVPPTTAECCGTSAEFPDTTESVPSLDRSTDFPTTDDEWYMTKFLDETTTTTISTQCSNITCLNGGTCTVTKDGPKCSCRFGWDGLQCEETITIKVVAFTGKSYLIHNLNNGTSTVVSLKLKTLSSFGVIFYAQVTSNMYMCLYVQDGFLKFQFSCGVQTMLFSETKYRVNTGYQIQILATVSLNKNLQNFDEGECSAALRINNTVAMSGEQTTATVQKLLNLPALYVGGFPRYLVQQLDLPVTNGIIGCMHSLQVDGLHKDIYMDAYDGNEISECSSLACISSPCHHSATCIENGQSWTCLCPLGFVGDTCNISVCINNPCQFGATCIQYPTNGFLCLCPLGKHGLFCEQDLEITQPTFTSTVRGYSSFIAYQLPSSSVQHTFELKFKFIPETMEQIALMVFMGQNGQHDMYSDHLALSFIKGYIALTWNLGAGPRRIFTPRPIAKKGKKMHSIRIGRTGSRAWLFVDGFKNITGRAPGRYMQLNVTPHIYIGGHESFNFLTLPHDLPLHTGFAGCIYDVEMRTSHVTLGLQKTHPEIGRSVAQCGTSVCSNYTCQHGGVCVQHGPTYSCLCPDGWFGPVCAYRHNLCDSNYHKCAAGSTCVPTALTYECDCPVGQTGKFCEKIETQLSDISFSGRRSYLLTNPKEEFQIKQFNFELEFKPLNDRALIMYVTENTSVFFTSLILKGGILEFRISTHGGNKNPESETVVTKVRSGTIINTGKWTRIRAGRFGQKLYLTVNGFTNSKLIPLDSSLIYNNISVYFGGIDNLAQVPYEVVSGLPTSFSGCVRQFFINYKHIVLNEQTIIQGRNIADCDGTACGADVCSNGGTCWLNTTLRPHCMCPEEYNGERCQIQVSCAKVPCRNKGRCVEGSKGLSCHCPLGWIGPFCDKEMPSLTPFLKDDSYIIIDKRPSKKRHSSVNKTSADLIHIKFSTTQENGMLLWNMKDQNFFGIGIENGNLKIVWSIDGAINQYVLTSNITVNNGIWHTLLFKFNDTEILSSIDNEDVYLTNQTLKYFLNSDGLFYLGGFPDNKYVLNETNGIFASNFNGCIKEFAWNEHAVVTNFKKYKGENVGSCFEYKG